MNYQSEEDLIIELNVILGNRKVSCVSIIDKETAIILGKKSAGLIQPLLRLCSPTLQDDRDVVLELNRKNGSNLQWTKEKFRDDEEIVMAALLSRPNMFKYASDRLKDNENIAAVVFKYNKEGIDLISDRIKRSKAFNKKLFEYDYNILPHMHPDLRNDIDMLKYMWDHFNVNFYTAFADDYHMGLFLKNIGDEAKPFFSIVKNDGRWSRNDMDKAFEKFSFHVKLSKELPPSQNNATKKLKI